MGKFTFAPVLLMVLSTIFVSGCGKDAPSAAGSNGAVPDVGVPTAGGIVPKAQMLIPVQLGSPTAMMRLYEFLITPAYADSSGSQPVTVVLAPNTSMTLDTTQWSVPNAISNAVLNFGYLNVSALSDNNLDVCGSNGHTHCGTAIFRMYTTGQGGPGLWNSADSYGAPITANLPGVTPGSVGLNSSGAAVLQSISIPTSKHVVHLSDFSPTPHYNVNSDFSNAGAGSYSATIVLEYALTD